LNPYEPPPWFNDETSGEWEPEVPLIDNYGHPIDNGPKGPAIDGNEAGGENIPSLPDFPDFPMK